VAFFALLLVMALTAPAFHPGLVGPWFGYAWVIVFIADIVTAFTAFYVFYLRKWAAELSAGYTTLPFGAADAELRDHRSFAIIRPAGVEPLSNRFSLRLGPERRRARLWDGQ